MRVASDLGSGSKGGDWGDDAGLAGGDSSSWEPEVKLSKGVDDSDKWSTDVNATPSKRDTGMSGWPDPSGNTSSSAGWAMNTSTKDSGWGSNVGSSTANSSWQQTDTKEQETGGWSAGDATAEAPNNEGEWSQQPDTTTATENADALQDNIETWRAEVEGSSSNWTDADDLQVWLSCLRYCGPHFACSLLYIF